MSELTELFEVSVLDVTAEYIGIYMEASISMYDLGTEVEIEKGVSYKLYLDGELYGEGTAANGSVDFENGTYAANIGEAGKNIMLIYNHSEDSLHVKLTSEGAADLSISMELLPESYADSPETIRIQGSILPEAEFLRRTRDELLLQTNPGTATWGLELWERALGIDTDTGKNIDYRRSRVIAALRGSGTTTAGMIRSVAESFSNAEVEVAEFPAEYRIEIRFVGTLGIPPNLEDMKAALDDIMPAHITWEFVFYWNTHGQTSAYTHEQLAEFTHAEIREEI